MKELVQWIYEQLNRQGWSQRELARRAGISTGALSMVIKEQRGAGPDFCNAVARAFGVPPESVFRMAGLLDEVDIDKQQTEELLHYFKQLSLSERINLIRAARAWSQSDRDVETGAAGIVAARE